MMDLFKKDIRLQCTFSPKKVSKILLVVLVLFVIHIVVTSHTTTLDNIRAESVPVLKPAPRRDRRPDRKILIWTPFNGEHYPSYERNCMTKCPFRCDITDDKSDIENVDAVNFHLSDLWTDNWSINSKETIKFPSYRRADQVWMLTNQEPPPNLFGAIDVFNGIFNWTVWYRKDSVLHFPYGFPMKLTNKEKTIYTTKTNIFTTKTRGITGKISNCKDAAKRYRLVQELEKYLDIDMYGKCYNNVCGDPGIHRSCDNITESYKFYLALENSRCKDYVTEKYWWALHRNQIPLVNWDHTHINRDLVIPNSYISMYDFPDFKTFADYVKKVSSNETLYNSYFNWKKTYKIGHKCASCIACKALLENRPPHVINDLDKWVQDDTCPKVGILNDIANKVDKFLFSNLGI